MFAQGLIEETRALTEHYGALGRTASQAVGYREVLDHLAGQRLDLTVERIQARTRRFAKRQGTWFRGLSECRFVDLAEPTAPEDVAQYDRPPGTVKRRNVAFRSRYISLASRVRV